MNKIAIILLVFTISLLYSCKEQTADYSSINIFDVTIETKLTDAVEILNKKGFKIEIIESPYQYEITVIYPVLDADGSDQDFMFYAYNEKFLTIKRFNLSVEFFNRFVDIYGKCDKTEKVSSTITNYYWYQNGITVLFNFSKATKFSDYKSDVYHMSIINEDYTNLLDKQGIGKEKDLYN
jgi:hypothetical protein